MRIVSAGMYFILGLLTYLWIGDYTTGQFVWTDPWLFVYMAFWPFILVWFFFLWAVIIGGIAFIAIWSWEKLVP